MSRGVKYTKKLAALLTLVFVIFLLTACSQYENPNSDNSDVGNSDSGNTDSGNTIKDSQIFGADVPEFYRNLSGLLSNEKNSHYFDKIEFTVGSNVVTVDGDERITANAPEYNENRLMLPVATIAEVTGATVTGNVDSANGMTIQSAYGDTISCSSNSTSLSINGMESSMDATPYSKGTDSYMSVNSIANALELEWTWNQEDSTVTLTAPYQNARLVVVADDELDTSGLGAETVLNDGTGIWILQFSSPSEAKAAMRMLRSKKYDVKPDYYLALDAHNGDALDFDTDTYSWGVINCGFIDFIESHKSAFVGNVLVAVVDTGVYMQHPFLNGRVLNGFDIIEGDFDPQDDVSHGTHVSGTIIDCTRNAPVQILPVRVLDRNGGSDSSVIAGIKYAVSRGADVINLSLGGARYDGAGAVESAIKYAIDKGCVVVISAGNDNQDTEEYDPAYITAPGAIVVSAGDELHNKAYFSNYGASVDLMAPGVSIKSSVPGRNLIEPKDGTSMAAPHVSAAVALLDLATGKTLSPVELEDKLHSATTNGAWQNPEVGYGFLDLRNANLNQSPLPNPEPEPEPDLPQEPEKATVPIDNAKWEGNYNWNGTSTLINHGNGELEIQNPVFNHAMIMQDVPVKPHMDYALSALMRVEGYQPENEDSPGGACVAVGNQSTNTINLDPYLVTTESWFSVSMHFNTGERDSITLFLSNGWLGCASAGTAYYKDIVLEEQGTNEIPSMFG